MFINTHSSNVSLLSITKYSTVSIHVNQWTSVAKLNLWPVLLCKSFFVIGFFFSNIWPEFTYCKSVELKSSSFRNAKQQTNVFDETDEPKVVGRLALLQWPECFHSEALPRAISSWSDIENCYHRERKRCFLQVNFLGQRSFLFFSLDRN